MTHRTAIATVPDLPATLLLLVQWPKQQPTRCGMLSVLTLYANSRDHTRTHSPMMPLYAPRSLSGTRSDTTMDDVDRIAPPPSPCTARDVSDILRTRINQDINDPLLAAMSQLMVCAAPQSALPRMKHDSANNMATRLPNICPEQGLNTG